MLTDLQAAAVRRILARELGCEVELESVGPPRQVGHRAVLRIKVVGHANTWIVKLGGRDGTVDPTDPRHARSWGFFPDLVGAAFVGDLDCHPPLAPRCVGAEPASGVFVLEDLGTAPDLADLLLGTDRDAAHAGMLGLARLLGQLHARTAGLEAEYAARWSQAIAHARPSRVGFWNNGHLAKWGSIVSALDLAVSSSVEADLASVPAALDAPTLRAYVHGDPCPDNVRPDNGGRLFDFQGGAFGLALLDGVYARMPFPTCWCTGRIPDDVVASFEATYREHTSSRGCRQRATTPSFLVRSRQPVRSGSSCRWCGACRQHSGRRRRVHPERTAAISSPALENTCCFGPTTSPARRPSSGS